MNPLAIMNRGDAIRSDSAPWRKCHVEQKTILRSTLHRSIRSRSNRLGHYRPSPLSHERIGSHPPFALAQSSILRLRRFLFCYLGNPPKNLTILNILVIILSSQTFAGAIVEMVAVATEAVAQQRKASFLYSSKHFPFSPERHRRN